MTTLHLIRHGKASPSEANYDQLHPRGQEQSRLLGAHLQAHQRHFDRVYCGPLVRQRDTLRLMREAAGTVGAAWPDERTIAGLTEAPVEMLVREVTFALLPHDEVLQAHMNAVQAAGEDRAALRSAMTTAFNYLIGLWRTGAATHPGLETYAAFQSRVIETLEAIVAERGDAAHVAVVTSNGVIRCMLGHVDPSATAVEELQFINTSVTTLAVEDRGLRMLARNDVAHLPDPALHTHL